MGKTKLKAIHSNYHDGYVGKIPDEDMYEDVKQGVKDWVPHIKSKLTAITIPATVFYRLMEMDKLINNIVNVGHPNIVTAEELQQIVEREREVKVRRGYE